MSEIVLEKIESSTKIGALLASGLVTILGLIVQKAFAGEPIQVELFWSLGFLILFFFGLQLMFYVRFYVEKSIFFREERLRSELQLAKMDVELRKMELEVKIRELD
jgi:hypothetical protein